MRNRDPSADGWGVSHPVLSLLATARGKGFTRMSTVSLEVLDAAQAADDLREQIEAAERQVNDLVGSIVDATAMLGTLEALLATA